MAWSIPSLLIWGSKVAEDLVHAYDPAKRREYYLKTRKLKGRKPTVKRATANGVRSKTSYTVKQRPKAKPKAQSKTRAQRQAERTRKLEARVNALKARLEALRAALAELTKQAKSRSGVKPASKKSSEPSKGTNKKAEKKTASQKAAAAKQSKEYYEKHKDEILADEIKSLNGKIKTIQERIAKMRKDGSIGAR